MDKVSFFIPVYFAGTTPSFKNRLLETIDSYFDLGILFNQKIAVAMPGAFIHKSQGCIQAISNASLLSTALKISSYAIIIIPTLALVLKTILRLSSSFHYQSPFEALNPNRNFVGGNLPPLPGNDDVPPPPPSTPTGHVAISSAKELNASDLEIGRSYTFSASEIIHYMLVAHLWMQTDKDYFIETTSDLSKYADNYFEVRTQDFNTFSLKMFVKAKI